MNTAAKYFTHLESIDKSKWNDAGMYPGLPICLSTDYKTLDQFLTSHDLFENRREQDAQPKHHVPSKVTHYYTKGIVSVEIDNEKSDRSKYIPNWQKAYDEIGGFGSRITVNQYAKPVDGIGMCHAEWYQRFFDVTKLIVDFAKENGDRVVLPYVNPTGDRNIFLID